MVPHCHGLYHSLTHVVARQPRQLLRAGFVNEVQEVVERHAQHVVHAARVGASRRRFAHWHRRAASHLKEEAVSDTASEAKKCQWGKQTKLIEQQSICHAMPAAEYGGKSLVASA